MITSSGKVPVRMSISPRWGKVLGYPNVMSYSAGTVPFLNSCTQCINPIDMSVNVDVK